RIGSGLNPPWYQKAIPETYSTGRAAAPYQWVTVSLVHKVLFDRSRFCSLGKGFPTRRGRPARLGRRSGGGANKRASVRRRGTQVIGRRSDCMRVRNSRAEKP